MQKIRLTAVILAAIMLLSVLVSCGDTPADIPEDVTTAAAATSAAVEEQTETPETEYALSNIPDDLKFPDSTIRILYWSDVERLEFEVKEETGETINDALLTRNNRVQEGLGINFDWVGTLGNFGNQTAFVNVCKESVASGTQDVYDVFAGYSLTAATIMIQGLSQDLKKYQILDFSLPWWPESVITQSTVNGRTYFASGDISSNVLHMMYCCMFNKDILADVHGDTDVYKLVDDGQWTLDKLMELSDGVYLDANGDNTVNYGDRFGFESIDLHFDCFFNGSGLKNLDIDAEGNIVCSDDYKSEKAVNLAEKLCKFLHGTTLAYGEGTNSKEGSIDAFANDLALFVVDRAYCTSFASMKASEVKYGILPVPKYDTDQDRYYTCMAFPYTMYSMSVNTQQPEAVAATLESMAYHSYTNVTPALFEVTMKLKYSKEAADAHMYDIVRENVFFDLGRIFTTSINNLSYDTFRTAVRYNTGSSYATASSTAAKQMKTYLKKVNSAIADLKQ